MRLLLTTDPVGGVWTFTQELAEGLLEQRAPANAAPHSLLLISFGRALSTDQSLWVRQFAMHYPDQFRFQASPIPLEWMPENEAAYADAEPLLLDAVASFAPDLLHLNQLCFGALPTSQPRLVTAHSDVLSWAVACRPTGLDRSPWLDHYLALASRGLQQASAIAAPTQASLADLRCHWPALPSRQQVIPNGRSVLAAEDSAPPRKMQAVTAGRLWDEAKNIASLAGLELPLPLLVAGDSQLLPGQMEPRPSTLRCLGQLPGPTLLDLFRESAIYLAPALYEPFGLAPLEAALCGCALVLHDLPSLREVWGDHALFYHSAPQLQEHLRQLVDDPISLERWQRRAGSRAATLSRSRMTTEYLALYHALLAPASSAMLSKEAQDRVA